MLPVILSLLAAAVVVAAVVVAVIVCNPPDQQMATDFSPDPTMHTEDCDGDDCVSQSDVAEFFAEGHDPEDVPPYGYADYVTARFLGCNSIYITDGQTSLLVDPFFTRPNLGKLDLFQATIQPDPVIVSGVLDAADITHVDAIICTHSHYDHALDIAEVRRCLTNKPPMVIVGSKSVANVALGGGIPEEFIRRIDEEASTNSFRFGRFTVEILRSRHGFLPWPWSSAMGMGEDIEEPIIPPDRLAAYKEGGTYAIKLHYYSSSPWVSENVLIQGSANYDPVTAYASDTGRVGTLILGIAGFDSILSWAGEWFAFRDNYYQKIVADTRAHTILFSHWDDFTRSLAVNPKWFGDPRASVAWFREKNPDLVPKFMPIWQDVRLFSLAD